MSDTESWLPESIWDRAISEWQGLPYLTVPVIDPDLGAIAVARLPDGREVYGADSPLARTTEYATIAAITRDDVVAFHRKHWHPNNILLGVVGDFDPKVMRKTIEAAFAAWPKGPESPMPVPAYRKDANPGVFFVEKSDVTQATVGMAHLGMDRKNPDYFAVQVMNEVLGGGFSARMFSNIRRRLWLHPFTPDPTLTPFGKNVITA